MPDRAVQHMRHLCGASLGARQNIGAEGRQLPFAFIERGQRFRSAAGGDQRGQTFDRGKGRRHGVEKRRRLGAHEDRLVGERNQRRQFAVGHGDDAGAAILGEFRGFDRVADIAVDRDRQQHVAALDRAQRVDVPAA